MDREEVYIYLTDSDSMIISNICHCREDMYLFDTAHSWEDAERIGKRIKTGRVKRGKKHKPKENAGRETVRHHYIQKEVQMSTEKIITETEHVDQRDVQERYQAYIRRGRKVFKGKDTKAADGSKGKGGRRS